MAIVIHIPSWALSPSNENISDWAQLIFTNEKLCLSSLTHITFSGTIFRSPSIVPWRDPLIKLIKNGGVHEHCPAQSFFGTGISLD